MVSRLFLHEIEEVRRSSPPTSMACWSSPLTRRSGGKILVALDRVGFGCDLRVRTAVYVENIAKKIIKIYCIMRRRGNSKDKVAQHCKVQFP